MQRGGEGGLVFFVIFFSFEWIGRGMGVDFFLQVHYGGFGLV